MQLTSPGMAPHFSFGLKSQEFPFTLFFMDYFSSFGNIYHYRAPRSGFKNLFDRLKDVDFAKV